MSIKVTNVEINILNTKTRIPFRFGIACMTKAPHLFLTAKIKIDGFSTTGIAAEGLLPKWFTKNSQASYKEEIEDMICVIKNACNIAEMVESNTVFELWKYIYDKQKAWAEEKEIPGLLWGFGVSMIERAIIDGFCKAKKMTFRQALKSNSLGIKLKDLYNELKGYEPSDLLDFKGLNKIYARHTVGLTDHLSASEISSEERVNDGLPQALDECVKEYGLKRFKIKLSGDVNRDIHRLISISQILNKFTDEYAFTLDGNENFEDPEDFIKLWNELTSQEILKEFLHKLLFVEQPIKRTSALSEKTKRAFINWPDKPPMIIDESDSEVGSLLKALECGYEGTSHKNCKGIIKGITNACLLKYRSANNPDKQYILSGEDLVNIGPVALLQDLTVSSLLGISHIERNGHHYFKGLSIFPKDIQENILNNHNDLYKYHENGFVTLDIKGGKIDIESLLKAPFGVGFDLDASRFTSINKWIYESLE